MKDKSNTGKIISIGALIFAFTFFGGIIVIIIVIIIWTTSSPMSPGPPPTTSGSPTPPTTSGPPKTPPPLPPGQCRLTGNHGPVPGYIIQSRFCIDVTKNAAHGNGWVILQDGIRYCCPAGQCLDGNMHNYDGEYWCNPPLP